MSEDRCVGRSAHKLTWHFTCTIILPKVCVTWMITSILHYQCSEPWHSWGCCGTPHPGPLYECIRGRSLSGADEINKIILKMGQAQYWLLVGRVGVRVSSSAVCQLGPSTNTDWRVRHQVPTELHFVLTHDAEGWEPGSNPGNQVQTLLGERNPGQLCVPSRGETWHQQGVCL